mmetsp:Transcript_2115/g.7261  ORF Transcript_2115/g.7261 Transcript_2115/m.7261 type:complete len:287 (+) Transcript_2115:920-1780(+)
MWPPQATAAAEWRQCSIGGSGSQASVRGSNTSAVRDTPEAAYPPIAKIRCGNHNGKANAISSTAFRIAGPTAFTRSAAERPAQRTTSDPTSQARATPCSDALRERCGASESPAGRNESSVSPPNDSPAPDGRPKQPEPGRPGRPGGSGRGAGEGLGGRSERGSGTAAEEEAEEAAGPSETRHLSGASVSDTPASRRDSGAGSAPAEVSPQGAAASEPSGGLRPNSTDANMDLWEAPWPLRALHSSMHSAGGSTNSPASAAPVVRAPAGPPADEGNRAASKANSARS